MQGNMGKIGQKTLIKASTKIGRNKSRVQTDRTIPNIIIIRDNETETRMLVYVAISGDRNVIKKLRRF